MKKLLSIILSLVMSLSVLTTAVAETEIKVILDSKELTFDVAPQIIDERTVVPLRGVFEALGATVDWNQDTQTVKSTKGDITIQLTINDANMYVNGKVVLLDRPACIVNERTLVPIRAISEAFGAKVEWDDRERKVKITSKATEIPNSTVTPTPVPTIAPTPIPTVTPAPVEWYMEGAYKVGVDIPAGDYYAVVTNEKYMGNYTTYPDSTKKEIDEIENFHNFTFFRCYDGQYLDLSRCKVTSIKNAPINKPSDGVYGAGTYRVGVDIPAGEYKFTATEDKYMGYYCAYEDITKEDIVDNENFKTTSYYTVENGQYLEVVRATAKLVAENNDSSSVVSNTSSSNSTSINYSDLKTIQGYVNRAGNYLKLAGNTAKKGGSLNATIALIDVTKAESELSAVEYMFKNGDIEISGDDKYKTLNEWYYDVCEKVSKCKESSDLLLYGDILIANMATATFSLGLSTIIINSI